MRTRQRNAVHVNSTWSRHPRRWRMGPCSVLCSLKILAVFVILFSVYIVLYGSFNSSLRSAFSYFHVRSAADLELVIIPPPIVKKYDAYCLDGSPPAFHIRRRTSSKNWLIALAPGKFCWDKYDCAVRAATLDGSSKNLPQFIQFHEGLLASDENHNPDFFDWNVVYIHYCDGGLFLGAKPVESTETSSGGDDAGKSESVNLYHRGYFILLAALHHLANANKIDNADNVLFVGSQLTGLALPLTIDHIRRMFFSTPRSTAAAVTTASSSKLFRVANLTLPMLPTQRDGPNVKFLLDSTFVVDRPNRHGRAALAESFAHAYLTHQIGNTPIVMRALTEALVRARTASKGKDAKAGAEYKSVFERCVEQYKRRDPSPADIRLNLPKKLFEEGRPNYGFKCLFPEYTATLVETRMLVIQSAYDRVSRELVLETDCDFTQLCEGDEKAFALINSYRTELVAKVSESVLLDRKRINGAFIPSCFVESWLQNEALYGRIRVDRINLRKLVATWFHGRALMESDRLLDSYELIDRIYPANTDCYHLEIERGLRRD